MSGFLQTLKSGRFAKIGNSAEVEARATCQQSLGVAQVEPALAELARAGVRFGGGLQIIANAFASVQAIPTTTATYLLYNSSAIKSLVVDSLAFSLASGTADVGATLMAAVTTAAVASPPTSQPTGWGVSSLSGSSRGSVALWQSGATIAAGSAWLGVAANTQAAATTAGSGGAAALSQGGIIVPPKYGLGVTVLSGAGTNAKYGVWVTWSELELDLE